ncbi:MAG TPA: FAD-dependent oxidoreductase, partial [Chroococcales cyanobacterium]
MSNPTTQNSSQGPSQSTYEFVDVEALRHDRPLDAVKTVTKSKPDLIVECDLLIVGGGTGGVAAALRALKPRQGSKSLKVCLTEETSWLGGQMTAQGVSALDENYLVETSGAGRSYQTRRETIRRFYREERSLTPEAQQHQYLNPGNCWVTRLAFEPQVVVDILAAQMKPFIDNGQLALYPRHKAVYVRDRDPRDQRSGTNGGGGGSDNAGSEDVRNSVIEKVGIINLDTHSL